MKSKAPLVIGGLIVVAVLVVVVLSKAPRAIDETYKPNLQAANFISAVTNPLFSLTPGKTFVYENETEEGMERIVTEVTSDKKTILGISATIVHDQVYLNDELIEDTFDWYAQDKDGTVWYLGEDTKELEDGKVVSTAGSWEAGVDGAEAGIVMLASPKVGDEYRQEYYKGEAEDMAEVVALNESVEVAYGSFDGCLKTRDWTPLEAKIDEYKYYCPGVGNLALEVGIYSEERVELVEVK